MLPRWIRPGSIINSDGWRGYWNLHHLGYKHKIVDHCRYFVHPLDRTNHTQSIEGQWKILKSGLPRGGSRRKYVASYLYARLWRQHYACKKGMDTLMYFLRSTLDCSFSL